MMRSDTGFVRVVISCAVFATILSNHSYAQRTQRERIDWASVGWGTLTSIAVLGTYEGGWALLAEEPAFCILDTTEEYTECYDRWTMQYNLWYGMTSSIITDSLGSLSMVASVRRNGADFDGLFPQRDGLYGRTFAGFLMVDSVRWIYRYAATRRIVALSFAPGLHPETPAIRRRFYVHGFLVPDLILGLGGPVFATWFSGAVGRGRHRSGNVSVLPSIGATADGYPMLHVGGVF